MNCTPPHRPARKLALRNLLLTAAALLASQTACAQIFERRVGDFALKLATTPIRSMAQGLVSPTAGSGSFHGGLDVTHESGLYMGQWSPSFGFAGGSELEIDSYLGFKKPFDTGLGYELGMIRYSHPNTDQVDSYEFYAGLRLLDRRVGAAFSNDFGRSVSTLFVDFGAIRPTGLGLRMQYAAHRFSTSQAGASGAMVAGFNDWSLNISRPWLGIDMNLIYSASNLSDGTCNLYNGHNQRCGQALTLKAATSFF